MSPRSVERIPVEPRTLPEPQCSKYYYVYYPNASLGYRSGQKQTLWLLRLLQPAAGNTMARRGDGSPQIRRANDIVVPGDTWLGVKITPGFMISEPCCSWHKESCDH